MYEWEGGGRWMFANVYIITCVILCRKVSFINCIYLHLFLFLAPPLSFTASPPPPPPPPPPPLLFSHLLHQNSLPVCISRSLSLFNTHTHPSFPNIGIDFFQLFCFDPNGQLLTHKVVSH